MSKIGDEIVLPASDMIEEEVIDRRKNIIILK